MGLRSRKEGGAGEAARVRKADAEGQMLGRADEQLRHAQVHTEAFNVLWRDFIVKMSVALVFYSIYAAYAHQDNQDHLAVDVLSVLYYVASLFWIQGIDDSYYSFVGFLKKKPFIACFVTVISQSVFYYYHHLEKDGKLHPEFFPTPLVHFPLIVASLVYMRSSATTIKRSRDELNKR